MGELIEHFEDPSISERILSSTRSFEGRLLKVDSVDIELPNGHRTTHEVVRHPGAVCVVALDDQGRVLVVRQYRTALERVTVEVPAGNTVLLRKAAFTAKFLQATGKSFYTVLREKLAEWR